MPNKTISSDFAAKTFCDDYAKLRAEIAKAVVGHDEIVEGVLVCLFAGGHALLEGVPGLGKTLLIRTLSDALDLDFSRIAQVTKRQAADTIDPNDPATWGRVSRNAPCPCGSGKKYKQCHGKLA